MGSTPLPFAPVITVLTRVYPQPFFFILYSLIVLLNFCIFPRWTWKCNIHFVLSHHHLLYIYLPDVSYASPLLFKRHLSGGIGLGKVYSGINTLILYSVYALGWLWGLAIENAWSTFILCYLFGHSLHISILKTLKSPFGNTLINSVQPNVPKLIWPCKHFVCHF